MRLRVQLPGLRGEEALTEDARLPQGPHQRRERRIQDHGGSTINHFPFLSFNLPPQYPSDIWRAENEPLFARRITFHN